MSVSFVLHVIGALSFGYGFYYDWTYVLLPKGPHKMGGNFAGKLQYLTVWDVLIQTFYYSLCVYVDFTGSRKVRKFKDTLQATIAFPLACFVCLTFWGIWAVDRELIFPVALDPFFPAWLNHLMHTNIVVFTVLETITCQRVYPKRSKGLTILTIFLLCYLVWMHVIYYVAGFWVYPVMEVFNTPLRIVFFAVLLGLVISLYIIGEKLNNFVWGEAQTNSSKTKRN